jgi:hypothetical protein
VTVAETLLHSASSRGLEVSWGSGAKIGYGTFVVTGPDGVAAEPFGISTNSKLDLYPNLMRFLPPFDRDEVRLDFIRRIGAAAGTPVEDTVADETFKSFPLDKLSSLESLKAVVMALDWFVDQAGVETPRVRA